MQHRNAPLNPTDGVVSPPWWRKRASRSRWPRAVSKVAKSTVHAWVSRWRAAAEKQRRALSCLQDRSSRPHTSPAIISEADHSPALRCASAPAGGPRLQCSPSPTRRCTGRSSAAAARGAHRARRQAVVRPAPATCCTWTPSARRALWSSVMRSPAGAPSARVGQVGSLSTPCKTTFPACLLRGPR